MSNLIYVSITETLKALVAGDFSLMPFKRPSRYFTGSKVDSCLKFSTKRKT